MPCGSSRISCGLTFFPYGLTRGNFKFLSSRGEPLIFGFLFLVRQRGPGVAGVCIGELPDISTDMRSASCNWSLFHLLSYLFVGSSLDR